MDNWREILEEHGPMVWRTVYRLLGRHDDALDCYQETFLAAYRASSGRPVEHWPSFLATLAARRAIDRLRHRVRLRVRFAPIDDVPEPVDAGDSPVDLAEGSERLEQVRALLAARATRSRISRANLEANRPGPGSSRGRARSFRTGTVGSPDRMDQPTAAGDSVGARPMP